jgi:uncharacterized protein YggE
MTRRTVPALLGALLVVATLAGAGVVIGQTGATDASTPDRSITVTGSSTAEAQPDQAVLRIAVEETAENAADARDAVAENVSAVRTALTDLGIGEDQIRTVDYDLHEDERRAERRARERGESSGEVSTVYRASHELAVEMEDTDAVGMALDRAIDNGATVRNVQFTLSEDTRDQLRTEALEDAVDDARGEADTIAASAGLDVTGLHTVETRDRRPAPRRYELAAAGDATAGTDIATGPVSVTATVEATYNATA